jgi:hypothetical protein
MGFRTPTFGQFNQQQQAQDKEEMQPIGKRQKGTGFTNIGKILGANVGAGERIGGQVGKGIGAQAGQLKMGTTEAQRKFQQSRDEAAGKAREAIGGIGQYLGNEAGLAGMTEEQAKTAREKFQKEGMYAGPSGIQDQAQLQARSQALGGLAGTAMSGATGERGLLRSMVAGPGMYTRGQSLLDTALLGQSEAGKRAIRSAAQQASTAARTTGAAIDAAEEQAAATKKIIGKEREDVATKTGEKLEEVEKAGGKAAEQFADDLNRFNTLMTATRSLDKEGKPVFKDQAGNIIEITDRDRGLISNPEQFGLQAGDISLVDKDSYGDVNKEILEQLAFQNPLVYQSGMRRYTPEQEAMARNLALFKGEPPKEYKPFETDIYKTGKENIEQKAKSYGKIEERKNQAEKAGFDSKRYNDLYSIYNRLMNDPSHGSTMRLEGYTRAAKEDRTFEIAGQQAGFTPDEIKAIANKYGTKNQVLDYVKNYSQEQQNLANTLSQDRSISMADYLARLYGMQPRLEETGRGPTGKRNIVQK